MNILRSLAAAAALLLLSAPAISAVTTIAIPQNDDAIILPHGSPLHFRKFGPEHAVEFDGAIELTGTWYYGDNQINDTNAADPTVTFVPDRASFARLPRFKLRGQPGSIYLTNENDLLKAVALKEMRAKVEKKGGKYLSGHIDIWVDKFEAGIECDAPFFNAHFLRVAQPPVRVALGGMPEEGC